jgi:hypothetical protein
MTLYSAAWAVNSDNAAGNLCKKRFAELLTQAAYCRQTGTDRHQVWQVWQV